MEGGATAPAQVRGRGRPRKAAEEPGNFEALIDSVGAALSKKAKAKEVLRPLCSIAVPNGLLLQAHRQQVPSYVTTINAHIPEHILVLDTACTRLERGFARGAGKLHSALSTTKGSARKQILEKVTHCVVGSGETLDVASYMSERESMQVHVLQCIIKVFHCTRTFLMLPGKN